MIRRRALLLSAAIVLVAMVSVGLWDLPELVRRMAVDQVVAITGRQATIEDVDLNLFTGSVAVKGFRLAEREGQGPEPFMRFERLEAQLFLPALVLLDVRLRHVGLTGLDARVIRTGESEFNFSDILAHIPRRAPSEPKPSRFSVTFDRVALVRTRVLIEDRTVTPPADWSLQSLDAEARSITTREGSPGRGRLRLRSGEASVEFDKAVFQLSPLAVSLTVKLAGMDLTRVVPYIRNPDIALEGGVLGATLDLSFKRVGGKVEEMRVGGEVGLERFAVSHSETPGRSIAVARLSAGIRRADVLDRSLVLSSVAVEGADIGMVRRASGELDLLQAIDRFIERRAATERERIARDRPPRPRRPCPPRRQPRPRRPRPPRRRPRRGPLAFRVADNARRGARGPIGAGVAREGGADHHRREPAPATRRGRLAGGAMACGRAGRQPHRALQLGQRCAGHRRRQGAAGRPGPGRARGPGGGRGATSLGVAAGRARARLAHELRSRALTSYTPSNVPGLATAGLFTTELELDVARKEGTTELAVATAAGSVRFANLVLARRGCLGADAQAAPS